jgi:hypothetical protein
MGRIGPLPVRRIAAQGDDVADARVPIGAGDGVDSSLVAATQVRCAAGFIAVSRAMRTTVSWVRSRVDPPAP